jgi:hypothetical protein
MKLGNILAGIGIICLVLGFFCFPLWNLSERPYVADPSYPKGSIWIMLSTTGMFLKTGIILMLSGGLLLLVSKLLPKRYWQTVNDLILKERREKFVNGVGPRQSTEIFT